MKALVASMGTTLDSPLAPNEESAEWYLIVDLTTKELSPVRAIGQPLQDVLKGASAHGVRVFISGSHDAHSQATITTNLSMVFFVQEMTVRDALECWQSEQLEPTPHAW